MMQSLIAAWSDGLEQRVVHKAINEWHGRLRACVRAEGQHLEHLLSAANFSFWLILLFYNFAKTSCLARCQIVSCKGRFGGLSDVKVLLQNFSGMYLLKIIKLDATWQTCCTQ